MTHDLQIVAHVWAKDCPQYADFAKYQVHALRAKPPKCDVLLTYFYSPEDWHTCIALERQLAIGLPPTVTLRGRPMGRDRLFRRAIGRNEVCRNPEGLVLWLTDCDYVISGEACDSVCYQVKPHSQLCYPRTIMQHKTHEIGDRYAAGHSDTPAIDVADFETASVRKAIGGVQIIGADLARQVGYLPEMTSEYDPQRDGFGYFKDDANWRRYTALPDGMINARGGKNIGEGTPIDVPGVFRLRHSINGYRS